MIELIDKNECKRRKNHNDNMSENATERYAIYRIGITNILPWLKDQIKDKGVIYIRNKDIAKEMDNSNSNFEYFTKRCEITIYRAMRHILREHDIDVHTGEDNSGNKILIMEGTKE